MLTLKIMINKNTHQEVSLRRPEESIGRSRTCTLRLTDASVSGLHAHIRRKGKTYLLVDEGSTNGVYVNSVKVKRHELEEGDQIRLGRVGLLVSALGIKPKGPSKKKPAPKSARGSKAQGDVVMRRKTPVDSKA